jgi:hypothetical protein
MRMAKKRLTTGRMALLACGVVLCWVGTASPQMKAASLRTISGVITDDGHEPLRGAVVELENPANHEIVSYLTGEDGRYTFKRVDSHTDFQLWATFRGRKSAVHTISMYDSHLQKVINIVCKTY